MQAVIWDMDGTLIDSTRAVPEAFARAVVENGGPEPTHQEVIGFYHLGPVVDILAALLQRPATQTDVDAYERYLAETAGNAEVYPGIKEVLVEQQRLGLQCAVFTGGNKAAAHLMLGATGLLPHFSAIVGGDEIKLPKPEPDGIIEACKRLDVSPSSVAYVGDGIYDLLAALAAHAKPIGAGWGHLFSPSAIADHGIGDRIAVASTPADVLLLLQ